MCFRVRFLLSVQVGDEFYSPWHYTFIIHSVYSASVKAQEDIHLWICFVLLGFTKSTSNWISVDLQRYSISLHVLGLSIIHHPSNQELSTWFQLWNSHLHITSSFHIFINTWILQLFKSPTDKWNRLLSITCTQVHVAFTKWMEAN